MASAQRAERLDPEELDAVARAAAPGNRQRVLHYLCSDVRGGIEEHVLSLLTALEHYGFVPHLAAPQRLLDVMNGELRAATVKAFAISRSSPWDFTDAARFAALLRRERIDLVHSHSFIASMFASPLARLAGVPAVVETFHLREVWREGKPLKGRFWLDRQIGRFVDRYVAVSRDAARHLTETKLIPVAKVRTILNGRDLARFHPPTKAEALHARAALKLSPRGLIALLLARLEPQKGHRFLIDALAQVAPSWPNLTVLFAGSGGLESDLKEQRDCAGLRETIRFVGQTTNPETLLAAADIVVLPSLYEGLPLTVIEALSAGRALLATDVEGTREVVVDGETGVLVPPRDAGALADGLQRLLRSPDLRRRLGARGRRFVEEHFDVRRQVEETISVYRELLSKHRAGRLSVADT